MSLLEFRCRVEKGNRIRVPKEVAVFKGMVPGRLYLVSIFSRMGVEGLPFHGRLQRSFRFQIPKVLVESEGIREGDILDVTIQEIERR